MLLLAAVDRPRDWGEDTGGDLTGERHEVESYLRRLQARLASATGNDVEAEAAMACVEHRPHLRPSLRRGAGAARENHGAAAPKTYAGSRKD